MTKNFKCELCERETQTLTGHHLIPKEKGGRDYHVAYLCKTCHAQIHALFTNLELSYRFYTIEKLKKDERIIRYLSFVEKHPGDTYIPVKKSKYARTKR